MTVSAPEQVAAVGVTAAAAAWVDQAAAATALVTERAAAAATSLLQGYDGWYSPKEIASMSADLAALSLEAQTAVADAMAEYVTQTVSLLAGVAARTPSLGAPVIRNGTPLDVVHQRTMKAYRLTMAEVESEIAAMEAAIAKEIQLLDDDIMLAGRQAEMSTMLDLGVTHYRRVLRPELSQSGSCLLCVAASLEVYSIEDLLPIHNGCKCKTMPIIDGNDPAEQLNQEDRERVYKAAGTSNRDDLRRLRVKVAEHGELGPVLVTGGQRYTGAKQVPPRNNIDGDRTTEQLEETLAALERSQEKFASDGTRRRIEEIQAELDRRAGGAGNDDGGQPPGVLPTGVPGRPSLGDFIVDTRQPPADHELWVEDSWRATMDREFGSAGLRTELDFVTFAPDNIHFSGTIYQPDGPSVGSYDRVIYRESDGTLWAEHAYLSIDDKDLQGTGLADELNATLYDWYRESGFERVELDANIDVGGYAWARAGYTFLDQFSAERTIDRLRNEPILGTESGAAVRDILDRADRLPFGDPNFPSAFEVSQAGRGPQHQGKDATWPGKRAMIGLGKNWRGVLWL